MNNIRFTISTLYQVPIQNMSFIAYFNYLNESGKITARSLLEGMIVILTFLEEQEKRSEQIEANFRDIHEILEKLAEKKTEGKTGLDLLNEQLSTPPVEIRVDEVKYGVGFKIDDKFIEKDFKCEVCDKSFKQKVALIGHSRSHKKK